MSAYRAVLLVLFVVGGTLFTAVPTSASSPHSVDVGAATSTGATSTGPSLVPAATEGPAGVVQPRATAVQNATANNSSLGADISSFMQSSIAEVGGAVETGMWTAAYNATDNRTVRVALVERQTADLREELAELRQRKAELVNERNETAVSDAAYKAKLGHLVGRIHALRAAVNATAVRAREVNANVAAVRDLRTDVDNLTGPEISAVARNVTGIRVENGQRGRPADVGNENGIAGADNRTTGPPSEVADGASNEGQRGPPDHADAPLVGNESGNETASLNASTPATRPVTINDGTNNATVLPDETSIGDAATIFSTVSATTNGLVGPVSDALAVRTYAFSRALPTA